MSKPAAKQGDMIVATDTHIVLVPSPGGPVPTPLPHPFVGPINQGCSTTVLIEGQPAAVVGSAAANVPPHIPTPPGTAFQRPPLNRGTILTGSATVLINGRPAARMGDTAVTCNDPVDMPVGQVIGTGLTVLIGG